MFFRVEWGNALGAGRGQVEFEILMVVRFIE